MSFVYADDSDFINENIYFVDMIIAHGPKILAEWGLMMNNTKTEISIIKRALKPEKEHWRQHKKLGSLLGDQEDVKRRINLACIAFGK